MEYKVLKGKSANKLKEKNCIAFLCQLDFNLARVYLLCDWTYLVMPFNPFSNCLLISKQELLQKWIKERHFPVSGWGDRSYFEKSQSLKNLASYKEGLKEALCDLIFKEEKRSPDDLCAEEIDCIYEVLSHRNLFEELKLNFTVLLGDYIIGRRKDLHLRWGLLSDRQYINPVLNLIIVTDQKQQGYYELEKEIGSKRGYAGVDHYLQGVVLESKKQVEDMLEIVGVM